MQIQHPDPRRAVAGLSVSRGAAAALASPIPTGPIPRKPQEIVPGLVDILPPITFRHCYASEIVIPANTSFGADGTSLSAWYGLERIEIDRDTGQEMGLAGYMIELLSTDSTAAGTSQTGSTVTAWGDARGEAAALVIGKNLPIERKRWTAAPCYAPGIELAHLESPRNPPEYIGVHGFPTGTYAATNPGKIVLPRTFLPTLYPLTEQTTLDVALVVRRSQIASNVGGWTSGLTAKALIGRIKVQLALVPTMRDARWNR